MTLFIDKKPRRFAKIKNKNKMKNETVELEIVNPDEKLVKYAGATGLEKASALTLADSFKPVFIKSRAAIDAARGVAESVKDATCVKEIRKSRACRLELRAVRLESEGIRKKQKEHALIYGRAVDGFHNILLADLSPVETALQEAEDIAERAEAARLAALKSEREKELQPHLETPIIGDLSELSATDYARMLSDAKLLKQAKLDAIAKAAEEAKAKAEAERIERERIAAENVKLKSEAIALEAAAKSEREAAEKKLADERAAAEAAAKIAAEKARKEREAVEAKAKAERAAAEAEASKERHRLQFIAAEERAKLAAVEAAAKKLRDAESKLRAEVAAAEKKAAAAPDNSKAQAFADALRKLQIPKFNTQAFADLPSKIEALVKWIESQISAKELL
jgi:hypothetical protein